MALDPSKEIVVILPAWTIEGSSLPGVVRLMASGKLQCLRFVDEGLPPSWDKFLADIGPDLATAGDQLLANSVLYDPIDLKVYVISP